MRSRETGGGATAGRGTTPPPGMVGGHFNTEAQAGKSISYKLLSLTLAHQTSLTMKWAIGTDLLVVPWNWAAPG